MTQPSTVHRDAVSYVIEPLHRVRNWMKFLAVLLFVAGGVNVLSVVGLLVAPVPITIGVWLWQAASGLDNPADVERLRHATSRLRRVFLAYAVLAVIGLIGFGLAIGFGLLAAIAEAV